MSTRLAVISDTHLPRGHRRIPEACLERCRAADLIVHAGDITTTAVLVALRELGEVVAVAGNNDEEALQHDLPEVLEIERDGVTVGIVHDAGPARGRPERLVRRFPTADLVIFGHSHIPNLERDPVSGRQILNPGSPTDPRRQPRPTMAWVELVAGRADCRIVPVD